MVQPLRIRVQPVWDRGEIGREAEAGIEAFMEAYTFAAFDAISFDAAEDILAFDNPTLRFIQGQTGDAGDYAREAARRRVERGGSLWPYYSGLSGHSFVPVVNAVAGVYELQNETDYAQEVEEQGTIGRIPGGKTPPAAGRRTISPGGPLGDAVMDRANRAFDRATGADD